VSDTVPAGREGYRPVGGHAFALKTFALIAGLAALTVALNWLIGGKVPTSVLLLLNAMLWIVISIRSILSPRSGAGEFADETEIRASRRWHVGMLAAWMMLGAGQAIHMLGWPP